MKKKLLGSLLIVVALVIGVVAIASSTGRLSMDANGRSIQIFAPTEVVVSSGAATVSVVDYKAVMLDTEVTIYFGSETTKTFVLPKGVALGTAGFTSIHVSAACNMLCM